MKGWKRLWKHEYTAVCVHPGWDLFTGWFAIRESWINIFRSTEVIKFTLTNTKVRVFDTIAVVVCLENIETVVNKQRRRFGVIATNIYERKENQWLLYTIMARRCQITYPQTVRPLFHRSIRW